MEFLRFIPWLWNKLDDGGKALFVLLFLAVVLGPSMYMWGIMALLVFVALVIATGVLLLLVALGANVVDYWREYKEERAKEAERIVARLKGKGTYF